MFLIILIETTLLPVNTTGLQFNNFDVIKNLYDNIEDMIADFVVEMRDNDNVGVYINNIKLVEDVIYIASIYADDNIVLTGVRILYSIVKNHLFRDGNKRIGYFVLNTYLEAHGIKVNISPHVAAMIVIMLASINVEDKENVIAMVNNILIENIN